MTSELNPAQQRIIDSLFARGLERPRFDAALQHGLREFLESSLEPVAAALDRQELHVDKWALARVHHCERHYVAEAASAFEWSPATARGTLAHAAIEQLIFSPQPRPPLEVVDEAMARTLEHGTERSPRSYLERCSPSELAEVRSEVNDVVVKFEECFPPLPRRWRPRTETSLRTSLCRGRIHLRGKVDLLLGIADGMRARSLVIDLKTGGMHASHVDDLRFYALLMTLRLGVPPFRVASYYLDEARWQHEDVTPDVLEAAARRVAAGAQKLADLRLKERPPTFTPGLACTYCPVRDTCEGAVVWARGPQPVTRAAA